ncbi:four-carbon acid sugar kinase family protein [Galbitalea sp. SE-J8]|uniref:3-oxo-tetronate kinase n=1 Tax=Galbitalea sp. SE-J8 TaxID=3054952 RepID=UPI00259C9952|nr:3-oxo-tetronate kinase [Galbitalea sp. SE-J8]MDM4762977.1 four-carbon acid sugar kinase family protein [Galbitalea sp. SE-J8]
MIHLGVIADDFTGATDVATALRERGLRVIVALGADAVPPPAEAEDLELDAVVVAVKTRTIAADRAVEMSLEALRHLTPLGPRQIYVKYCSTFDSTKDGNIGPVLDAVLTELGASRTIVAPAFPANGRTVYRGHLFVGDELLAESPMRDHPLTPMTESRVAAILRPQTRHSVGEVSIGEVSRGADALRAALEAADSTYIVVDTTTEADLATVSAAVADWPVISGSAGLAYGVSGPHDPSSAEFPVPAGRRLVLCGSASATTRAQISSARDAGATMIKLDIDRLLADPLDVVRSVTGLLADLPPDSLPVVHSVGRPDDVRDNAGGRGPAEHIERVVAAIASTAVESLGFRQVIVAGGETSGAVATALGCRRLLIGPQIAPGVCWSVSATSEHTDVLLALKSGNFGGDDMFTTAWEALA